MSKRYLRKLVEEGLVSGWDDPRMPTLCGMRRRGYTPEAIRSFIGMVGLSKSNSTVEMGMLEHCVREALKTSVSRRMAVLDPIELVIENYPEDRFEMLTVDNNTENPEMGSRQVRFGRTVYIEREDFAVVPPPKYKRLSPGKEVRLMGAYIVTCTSYEADESGRVTRVFCQYDRDSLSGTGGRKVKGVLHFVEKTSAVPAEVRLYDRLILDGEGDYTERFNENALVRMENAVAEASLAEQAPGTGFQFIRQGYFCLDPDSTGDRLVFNRTVGLRDTWAKINR